MRHGKRIGYIVVIGCLIVAAICKSRAFVIGYSCSLVFLYLMDKPLWSKKALLLSSCLLLWIGVLVIFIKSDSSAGRLFIYKIAFRVLEKNFPGGVGAGHFQREYLQCQADYFRAGHYTTKELLLADNISHVYNDYFELIIEWGLVGILVLIVGFALLIYGLKGMSGTGLSIPGALVATQLIALLVAACFTHVFEIHYRDSRVSEARDLLKAGFMNESIKAYQTMYPRLNNDQAFLDGYAEALIAHRDYRQAVVILDRLNDRWTSSVFIERTGDCYTQLGDYTDAEKAYLNAIYMVPHRFTSRYSLFNLYLQTHQTNKARWIGNSILTLPIKIPSPHIERIKQDVAARMPAVQ